MKIQNSWSLKNVENNIRNMRIKQNKSEYTIYRCDVNKGVCGICTYINYIIFVLIKSRAK